MICRHVLRGWNEEWKPIESFDFFNDAKDTINWLHRMAMIVKTPELGQPVHWREPRFHEMIQHRIAELTRLDEEHWATWKKEKGFA